MMDTHLSDTSQGGELMDAPYKRRKSERLRRWLSGAAVIPLVLLAIATAVAVMGHIF